MPTGIVKWFNGRKGYGFIEPEDGGNDVFVHVTALKDSGIKFLNEGDKVSYELTENRGRMAAGNLSLDGESSSDSDEAPSDEVEEAAEEEAAEEEAAEEEAAEEEAAEEAAAEEEAAEEEAAEEDSEEDS
jgi:CspA family cold shock protein